jgi:hypothetical protein
MKIVSKIAEKGITLYCVGCEPALLPYKEFFSALAFKTGGQYVPLRNANFLAKVIVGGAVEEISLEKLMEDVKLEVEEKRNQGIVDDAELALHVQTKLKEKGTKTNQILLNDSNLEKASETAIKYSKISNMDDLRKEYKAAPSEFQSFFSSPVEYSASASSEFGSLFSGEFSAGPGAMSPTARFSHVHSASSSSPAPAFDSYKIASSEISYAQSERLVQKALVRKHLFE